MRTERARRKCAKSWRERNCSYSVSDGWWCCKIQKQKIKKQEYLDLKLEKNIDILNYVSNHNSLRPKVVIGFAAETNQLKNNAKKKLMEKNCDWVIANDVSNKLIGFDSELNEVTIVYKDKKIQDEKLSMKKKSEISDEIVDRVISQLN